MDCKEAMAVIETANSESIGSIPRGVYGKTYIAAIETLERNALKRNPCPVKYKQTKTIKYQGFECEIYYNYVPPYGMGRIPCNCWYAYSRLFFNGIYYIWEKSFGKDIDSSIGAAAFIRPFFRKLIKNKKRMFSKHRKEIQNGLSKL